MVAEKKSQLSSCFHLCETASVKRQQKSLYPATLLVDCQAIGDLLHMLMSPEIESISRYSRFLLS